MGSAGRFVVGVDGSEEGQVALAWVARFAELHDADVVPVLVWDAPRVAMVPHPADLPDDGEVSFQRDYEEAAAALLSGTHGRSAARIHTPEVIRGDAAKELCKAAEGADLLVTGSRGLGGFAGLMLGSVSAHLANAAPCPVAVIPGSYDPEAPARGVYVIGVDGSAHADAAVAWADRWAPPDATLRLVHTWQPPITLDRFNNWIDLDACAITAKQVAEEAAAKVRHHRNVQAEAIRTDARMDLTRIAAEGDVLVIGARGHRGIGRLLLGSVASSTLHHLTTPTIVVR